jgi:hypothetical protein
LVQLSAQGSFSGMPYGKEMLDLPWELSRRGTTSVTWDIEPDTYHAGDARALADYAVTQTRPGSIILMHPFCEGVCAADREALPQIIDRLRADGYRFVTVSELLVMWPSSLSPDGLERGSGPRRSRRAQERSCRSRLLEFLAGQRNDAVVVSQCGPSGCGLTRSGYRDQTPEQFANMGYETASYPDHSGITR